MNQKGREVQREFRILKRNDVNRLERGRFVRLAAKASNVSMSSAQLVMLLEETNWWTPQRPWKLLTAG